ncbi:MAG: caspase family protein, partial [Nitratireductor sp.]|nr:caspase family protein [Nitratireductor sp.]
MSPRSLASLASVLFAFAALFMAAGPASAAEEQRRMALVIGNNDYESISKLEKALNDADAIAEHLTGIGFTVTLAKDIGRRAMSRAVLEFEKNLKAGDVALFYYAGHGFSVSGQDYLLPVDIPPAGPGDESMFRDEAFL